MVMPERQPSKRPSVEDRPRIDAVAMTDNLRQHLMEQGGLQFQMRDGTENVTVLLKFDEATRRYHLDGAVGHYFKKPDDSPVTFAEDLSDAPKTLREAMAKRVAETQVPVSRPAEMQAEVTPVETDAPGHISIATEPTERPKPNLDAAGRTMAGKYANAPVTTRAAEAPAQYAEILPNRPAKAPLGNIDNIPYDQLPPSDWRSDPKRVRGVDGRFTKEDQTA